MELEIIIPYTYGGELRQQNLRHLIECLSAQKARMGQHHSFTVTAVEEINDGTKQYSFPYINRVNKHLILTDNRPFNKSWILNYAIKQSSSDKIIIIDGDMLFAENFIQKIVDFITSNPTFHIFSCYDNISALPGRDNPVFRQSGYHQMVAMGGAWYVNKNYLFNELGGMNENYFGYGGEDNDLWERAKFIKGKVPTMDYHLVHQYHPWVFPAPNRLPILFTTQAHHREIIERLKQVTLGQESSPTIINIDDIIVRNKR